MALEGGTGDYAGLGDDHIATGLDAAVPWLGDFIIH